MALNILVCADMRLRNYLLTRVLMSPKSLWLEFTSGKQFWIFTLQD